jgi:hypothetical protein
MAGRAMPWQLAPLLLSHGGLTSDGVESRVRRV